MQNVCLLQGTKKPSVVVSKFARLSISPSEANFETKTTLGCVKTCSAEYVDRTGNAFLRGRLGFREGVVESKVLPFLRPIW